MNTLHDRIAAALGWTVEQTHSLSRYALRDLVRPVDAALADELTQAIEAERQFLLHMKYSKTRGRMR